jgi:hypothetical protein
MRRLLCGVLAMALVFPLTVSGAEIDSVTGRGEKLRNSVRGMNSRINDSLRAGVERANERDRGCDEADLYRQLRKAIVSPFIGHLLAEELNDAEELDSRRVRFNQSIYRDLGVFDALSVHLKDLSAVIRLDDQRVGVDKFGHFFVEGWEYFETAYLEGKGIDAAMAWGQRAERTYFGLYTTGVYSYADLTLNFEGMRFWLRVLGQAQDPIEPGRRFNRPYVRCAKRFWSRKPYWRVKRSFRVQHYLSGGWDEAKNCCSYRNPEIAALIRRRVEEQEAADSESYTCPVDPNACASARERYGGRAERLLHPDCLAAEAVPRPWWKLW